MILFYNKTSGEIFGTISGRVHDQGQMKMSISNNDESVGRFIIGYEETNEIEEYKDIIEEMVEIKKDIFKKVKKVVKLKRNKRIEHNLDKFEILQRFEDNTPENPLDYKIENGSLIKVNNIV